LVLLKLLEGKYMHGVQNRNSIGHFSVLAALWFINALILIFGFPFLIYKKAVEIFLKTSKKPKSETNPKSARYFPCRIDSKL